MGRISRTITLARVSWQVLRRDRELLLLPVLSFLVSIIALALLWIPLLATVDTTGLGDDQGETDPALLIAGVASILLLSVIGVFFKGALVAGAHERLSGGDPTVRSALSRAIARIGGLLPWALLAGTVGLVLSALKGRAGRAGRFAVGLIGMAWETASYLVIPAIVVDDHRAISGLKASAALLKRTWGENLAARVGFGLLGIVAMLPAVIVVAAAGTVGLVVAVPWVALAVVVLTALGAVFQTALYLYATTGSVPKGFEQAGLSEAFITR